MFWTEEWACKNSQKGINNCDYMKSLDYIILFRCTPVAVFPTCISLFIVKRCSQSQAVSWMQTSLDPSVMTASPNEWFWSLSTGVMKKHLPLYLLNATALMCNV